MKTSITPANLSWSTHPNRLVQCLILFRGLATTTSTIERRRRRKDGNLVKLEFPLDPPLERDPLLDGERIAAPNDGHNVGDRSEGAHGLDVDWFESVPGRRDEVEHAVDALVCCAAVAFGREFAVQVVGVLVLDERDQRLPAM